MDSENISNYEKFNNYKPKNNFDNLKSNVILNKIKTKCDF